MWVSVTVHRMLLLLGLRQLAAAVSLHFLAESMLSAPEIWISNTRSQSAALQLPGQAACTQSMSDLGV